MKKAFFIFCIALGSILVLLGIILRPGVISMPGADALIRSQQSQHVQNIRAILISIGFSILVLAMMAREFGGKMLKHLTAALNRYNGFHETKSKNERTF